MGIVMRLALAISLAALPAAAVADPGSGKERGKGHTRAAASAVVGTPSRNHWVGCPPGLAKKRNGCQPPGQARKTRPVVVNPVIPEPVVVLPQAVRPTLSPVVVPAQRDSTLLITPAAVPVVVGQRYDRVDYITDPRLYGLAPAPEGQRYGIVGNQLVRLDQGTGTVLALIRLVEAILD